jgi:hypothetical protein
MHTIFLYSNYNINEEKKHINLILELREQLITCYNYPLEINHNNCNNLNNLNFKIEIINNGMCTNKTIFESGEVKPNEKTIFVPVKDIQKGYICPARIILYSDITKT